MHWFDLRDNKNFFPLNYKKGIGDQYLFAQKINFVAANLHY